MKILIFTITIIFNGFLLADVGAEGFLDEPGTKKFVPHSKISNITHISNTPSSPINNINEITTKGIPHSIFGEYFLLTNEKSTMRLNKDGTGKYKVYDLENFTAAQTNRVARQGEIIRWGLMQKNGKLIVGNDSYWNKRGYTFYKIVIYPQKGKETPIAGVNEEKETFDLKFHPDYGIKILHWVKK